MYVYQIICRARKLAVCCILHLFSIESAYEH